MNLKQFDDGDSQRFVFNPRNLHWKDGKKKSKQKIFCIDLWL